MVTPAPKPASGGLDSKTAEKILINEWLDRRYLLHEMEHGFEARVTIDEFLSIVDLSYPSAWLDGQIMTAALALLVKDQERSDVLVLTDDTAQLLYQVAVGAAQAEDLSATDPNIHEALLDESKRWIVVPCSDGMSDIVSEGKRWEEEKRNKEKQKELNTKDRNRVDPEPGTGNLETGGNGANTKEKKMVSKAPGSPPTGRGTHWGLLIVDKQTKVARWMDSLLDAKKTSEGKWKIVSMHPVGTVAGQILCGLEAMLIARGGQFTKGEFDTSTLKHTPHQHRHNNCKNDAGACGPFTFAFLEHILRGTPNSLGDAKAMFPASKRDRTRFNSRNTRGEVQRLIQQVAEQPDTFPMALTPQLVQALGLLSPEFVRQKVRRSASREKVPDNTHTIPRTAAGIDNQDGPDETEHDNEASTEDDQFLLTEMRHDRAARPSAYQDTGNDREALILFRVYQESLKPEKSAIPSTTDVLTLRTHDIDFMSMPDADIDEWVAKRPVGDRLTIKADLWYKKATLQHIFGGFDSFDKAQAGLWRDLDPGLHNKNLSHEGIIDSLKERVKGFESQDLQGKPDYYPDYYLKNIGFNKKKRSNENTESEAGSKKLKVDYATISELDLMKGVTDDIKSHKSIHKTRTPNEYTYRAILLVRDGGSFKNEEASRFEEIWIRDSNVFTEGDDYGVDKDGNVVRGDDLDAEVMRARMHTAYEVEPAEVSDNPSDGDLPPSSHDSSDDSNSDNLGNSGNIPGRKRGPSKADSNQPEEPLVEKPKLLPPNFRTLEGDRIPDWYEHVHLPVKNLVRDEKLKYTETARAKTYLERMFNDTFEKMQAEIPLSKGSAAEIRAWRKMYPSAITRTYPAKNDTGVKKFLNQVLMADPTVEQANETKQVVLIPNYRGQKDRYPEYWKDEQEAAASDEET